MQSPSGIIMQISDDLHASDQMPYTPPYTAEEIESIWRKARFMLHKHSKSHRKDAFGNSIHFDRYGDRDSPFGWEVGHIIPIAEGGTNSYSNLRPVHWTIHADREE